MPEHLHRAVGDFGRHGGSGRRPPAAGRAEPGSVNGNLLGLPVGNPVNHCGGADLAADLVAAGSDLNQLQAVF